MHLTLKKEATRPAGDNSLQQQAKFDAFLEEFNNERPHEALSPVAAPDREAHDCPDVRVIRVLGPSGPRH